ncbi:MAG TPA: glutathione S-transferase family protein [Nannocystis sp.]
MAAPLRLLTIGFSHYCEKARWALDLAGLDYVERDHMPIFHYAPNLLAGAARTVPALLTPRGVLRDSTAIVRFADEHLAPERRLFPPDPALLAEVTRLVERFDAVLGPSARRAAYFLLFADPAASGRVLTSTGPGWERRLGRLAGPLLRRLMTRGLKLYPEPSARAKTRTEAIFAEVGELLADGRRYLVGARFSAADLTFAALAAPVVFPPQYGFPVSDAVLPGPARAWVEQMRATPAGRFALRLYAEERPPVRAQGRSDMS